MTPDPNVTDLTRGVYRRIYSGFIKGQRINKLSLSAEAWFWRVLAAADDLGNAEADPELCRTATSGRRSVTKNQVAGWLREMKEAKLISLYKAKGEWYLHVIGFEETQPAGKNGKRIKRYPNPDVSGCIRVNPDESSASRASDNEDDNDNDNQDEVRTAKPRSVSKVKVCDEIYLSELQSDEAYKRLNVSLIYAKMVRWCSEKGKQPTRARLINWLNREDQPMESNGITQSIPRTASDRNVANLRASMDIIRDRSGAANPAKPTSIVSANSEPRRVSGRG